MDTANKMILAEVARLEASMTPMLGSGAAHARVQQLIEAAIAQANTSRGTRLSFFNAALYEAALLHRIVQSCVEQGFAPTPEENGQV